MAANKKAQKRERERDPEDEFEDALLFLSPNVHFLPVGRLCIIGCATGSSRSSDAAVRVKNREACSYAHEAANKAAKVPSAHSSEGLLI